MTVQQLSVCGRNKGRRNTSRRGGAMNEQGPTKRGVFLVGLWRAPTLAAAQPRNAVSTEHGVCIV
jgi:hypothetical protein